MAVTESWCEYGTHSMCVYTGPHLISNNKLVVLVRQLAMHINMATVIEYTAENVKQMYMVEIGLLAFNR